LYNLSIDFQAKKQIFPYKFAKEESLFYVGPCPSKEYFESYEEFLRFSEENTIFNFKKKTIEYCENDVLITQKVLVNIYKIISEINTKLFWKSYSAPSLSHKIFFKKYNNKNIEKKLSRELSGYVRKGYYGGRCEVFGNPYDNEITNYFDFSGMYAQCMLEKYHIGRPKFDMSGDFTKIGFHTICFSSDSQIPLLPYHYNGKLFFPNGKLIGTYWYEEIIKFVEMGGKVHEVYSSVIYEGADYVFSDFVQYFNNIRVKGGYYKVFAKLMINSLYGSFAMDEEEYFTVLSFSEEEFQSILENTTVTNWCKQGNCIISQIKKDYKACAIYNKNEGNWSEENASRNVSYAAATASKARIKLYNAFEAVQKDGGRLLYCDTDSIFAAYPESKIGKECGEIRWMESYTDAFFVSAKFYAYRGRDDIVKIKGIRQKKMNYDYIKTSFYANKDSIKFVDELRFIKKNYELRQEYTEKIIGLNEYDKRLFNLDKKSTTPVDLSQPTLISNERPSI
jgi:hypothetical protein